MAVISNLELIHFIDYISLLIILMFSAITQQASPTQPALPLLFQ